ncbi:MAG: orotate phosphoribosyltransferase [Phycisphaerae bacterium]|nr:orotate phosphoribosyltransferase [Phycisphaerae bacterium]
MNSAPQHLETLLKNARHPELARLVNDKAIQRGTFTLASGRQSTYYCDGKLVSFAGDGVALIAEAILHEIRDLDIDAIGGMDMGATPIVSAVALRAHQLGKELPSFIVRKPSEVKAHGTKKNIEGPLPSAPSRVVIVDDVVTSGGSILQAIDAVRERGHTVVLAISVLDRDGGGAEALKTKGVPYRALVTISELGIVNDEPGAMRDERTK